ncbi:hypothetical protein GCM10010220_02450 [Streptomyces parvulus]|nr:hypothetical protein GCM10010220_02450 [Streptomyces parvulus]
MVSNLVPAIPRGSPHDLARSWHDIFVPNAIKGPRDVAIKYQGRSFGSGTVHHCPGQSSRGCNVWPPFGPLG